MEPQIKSDRIERLVRRLVKLATKYRIPMDPDLGEACLLFAATSLEKHVVKTGFMDRASAWWDMNASVPGPNDRRGPDLQTMEQAAREMAQAVRVIAPPGAGFALVVYNFGPNGELTYVSTGDRNDTIGMLDGLLQVLKAAREKGPEGELRS